VDSGVVPYPTNKETVALHVAIGDLGSATSVKIHIKDGCLVAHNMHQTGGRSWPLTDPDCFDYLRKFLRHRKATQEAWEASGGPRGRGKRKCWDVP